MGASTEEKRRRAQLLIKRGLPTAKALRRVGLKRSTFFYKPRGPRTLDAALVSQIKEVWRDRQVGYKKMTSILRARFKTKHGSKKVYRHMKALSLLGRSRRFPKPGSPATKSPIAPRQAARQPRNSVPKAQGSVRLSSAKRGLVVRWFPGAKDAKDEELEDRWIEIYLYIEEQFPDDADRRNSLGVSRHVYKKWESEINNLRNIQPGRIKNIWAERTVGG